MKAIKPVILLLLLTICSSCFDNANDGIQGIDSVICDTINLQVSERDNVVQFNNTGLNNPLWEATYSSQSVILKFAIRGGFHNDVKEYIFKFNKENGCLVFDHAYYLSTNLYDPPFVNHIIVNSIEIQEWNTDTLLSGKVTYARDIPANPEPPVTRNFWVELDTDDYFDEPILTPIYFNSCIGNLLPITLDLNNDGTDDFSFDYTQNSMTQFSPVKEEYMIVANSLDANNTILRPDNNNYDIPSIVFSPPFDSDNKRVYADIDKRLGYLIELPGNYNQYSYWVTHSDRYSDRDTEGYIIVKMTLNGQDHYGWIQLKLSVENCSFEIIDSYFNPTPNEHVSVP
jgi:hypothetical protein